MPITKSAKKSLKVSETKRARNYTNKVILDKALKKVDVATISEVISLIDKAAKTNLIHKNKAAHMKSALTKKFGTPKKTEEKPKVNLPAGKAGSEKPKAKSTKSKA